MAYKIGKKRALGCTVLVTALSIAAVTLTPIGPLFVYGWLVPIISPVIPKPDDVPARAKAEYHWKGFGLTWYWEDRVSGGCARWWAAESYGGEPVRGLSVFEGGASCEDGKATIYRLSFLDHAAFGSGENRWPYEKCPFDLSEVSVRRLLTQIEELIDVSSGPIQTKMLEDTRSEIKQIGQLGLRAQQFGCRVNSE
ncbi:hypothetical protein [Alterisphingorhabdus coralli]|uniref:Uncharacterized protein n=1 Tax=Alterisphingorhabdus coralli TaxID=3071408 RepID=A0AA97F9V1_9SPHN|nr:hypothetical protein [Parasphingorhabdus sp. SCSIO 66989]WOE75922.1 hypothetical protein RB602_04190 [Parasphingorhabdus sp. SCSIO 66989]